MDKNNHPLFYFKSILEEHSLESLKNKTIQEFELSRGNDIKEVDLEKGIVKYIATFYDPIKDDRVEALATYNFYNEFGLLLKTKVKEAILNLDRIVNEFAKEGHTLQKTAIMSHLRRSKVSIAERMKLSHPQRTKVSH